MTKVFTDILVEAAANNDITTRILYDGELPCLEQFVTLDEMEFKVKVIASSEEEVAEKLLPYLDKFFGRAAEQWGVNRIGTRGVVVVDSSDTTTTVSFPLIFACTEEMKKGKTSHWLSYNIGTNLLATFDSEIQ